VTLNNSDNRLASLPLNGAGQKRNRIQPDATPGARIWTLDEVGAAMAHQLSEPLTALLVYLHEIKAEGERSIGTEALPNTVREMVEKALCETERVCDIMERVGHGFEVPADAEGAVARGREAIDSWAYRSNANDRGYPSAATPRLGHRLTTREREVLALIIGGASNKEGGHRLGVSRRTFEVHRAHIMEKLEAKNTADLVRIALSEFR
jgi:DNA-binding CsgD family transcriptional regulator